MPLLTAGGIAGVLGVVWKYWRIPVRFYKWHKAKEVEPAVGQIWQECGFSGKDVKWKITELTEDHIWLKSTTDKDTFGDYEETNMGWDTWEYAYIKKRKLFCLDANVSIEDQYFGDASEN